ncbi:malto-oligosyltrehalose synthase, partial [Streptomyces sp. NPDC058964]
AWPPARGGASHVVTPPPRPRRPAGGRGGRRGGPRPPPDPALRDCAPWALRTALQELLVRLRVYRPYASGDAASVVTEEAAEEARLAFAVPEEGRAVDVVRGLLVGPGDGPDLAEFRARFAQTSSALRAKSVEDTAFYRYVPLLSATEVGGDPGRPGVSPEDFHAYCTRVQRDWPVTGTVVSTHDTKRSADVRAALAVLTECPERWADVLAEVTRDGGGVPDAQLAWAAWQTVFGLGPAGGERVRESLLKHVREAGLYTSWTEQEPPYEEAVAAFVAQGPCGAPGEHVAALRGSLETHIRANVLGTALVHLTMPGVPDLYQGTEGEYRALVDPDNRRPVGFPPQDAAGTSGTSREKAAVTAAALRLRARRPESFGDTATYAALAAEGPAAAHCLAFTRSGEVVTAVTRLSLRLTEAGGWRDTRLPLPPGRWADVLFPDREFTDHARVAELFARMPVALLERVTATA